MSLEEETAEANSFYFLPEFTFSNTTFRPAAGTELELADGVIWLDDRAVVFQIKERGVEETSLSDQQKWFKNKVLKQATRQIKDTLRYLDANPTIVAKNRRDQAVPLEKSRLRELHKVILYTCEGPYAYSPYHVSSSVGFIHIFRSDDYTGVLNTILTLAELFEYLSWREHHLTEWPSAQHLPEQALLGHYLFGNFEKEPSIEDMAYVYSMQDNIEEWDVTGILHKFLDRSYEGHRDNQYHKILGEIAKLNRAGLRPFKERFKLSMEKARENIFTLPYRFSILRNDCGFLFIPLESKFRNDRRKALVNLTHACKYDQKVSKCIGLVCLADDDGWFTIDWCMIEYPWKLDTKLEQNLKNNFPFRTTKSTHLSRYTFSK